ncbi:MAG: ComEC/Rec2 family competence protein [Treponema sp.]|nr:ComEC/Rec2 family competence protein [Treponema sp.]
MVDSLIESSVKPLIKFLTNIPPLIWAAVGTAVGFYFLFNVHYIFVILLIVFLIGLFIFSLILKSFLKTSICSGFLIAGLILGLFSAFNGSNNINFGIKIEEVIAIEGLLKEDPVVVSGGSIMADVSLRRSKGQGFTVSSDGIITVFFPKESAARIKEFGRGAAIYAEGSLRSTAWGLSFSADSLHVTEPAPAIEQMRTRLRLNIINRFEKTQFGGLSLALLFGIRDNLDSQYTSLYREAGLSYILALSGMHLAIIAALISFLLKKPLGLKGCAIAGAVIIVLYCLFTGPMPSLNRAALMYVIGVITILFNFPNKAMSVLALSFIIQIIITPAAGSSLSFVLSYLAMLGILIIGKNLSMLLEGKIPNFLLQPLSVSSGAFLATAGVCSFTFGTIAPIGIIAGLAIVLLTAVFMIGSIIWLLLDLISISVLLNLPLHFLYKLMEAIAAAAGKVPGITANSFLVLAMSAVLTALIVVLENRRKTKMLKLLSFRVS